METKQRPSARAPRLDHRRDRGLLTRASCGWPLDRCRPALGLRCVRVALFGRRSVVGACVVQGLACCRAALRRMGRSAVVGGFLEGAGVGDPACVEDESGGAVQGEEGEGAVEAELILWVRKGWWGMPAATAEKVVTAAERKPRAPKVAVIVCAACWMARGWVLMPGNWFCERSAAVRRPNRSASARRSWWALTVNATVSTWSWGSPSTRPGNRARDDETRSRNGGVARGRSVLPRTRGTDGRPWSRTAGLRSRGRAPPSTDAARSRIPVRVPASRPGRAARRRQCALTVTPVIPADAGSCSCDR